MIEWLSNKIKHDIFDKDYSIRVYVQQMLRMTNRMFKWNNLPETIPERILEMYLQCCGAICFTKVEGEYYVFFGNMGDKPNVYYEPTEFIVANPGLNFSKSLTIGEECVVMRNDSMIQGLLPIMERYAKQLTENDISIYDAQVNMRIQSLIVATTDNAKASAELYLKRIEEGKLGVIMGKSLNDNALQTKPFVSGGQSNAMNQLIELHQYIKSCFLNDLGLDSNGNMKRERLNTAEVEQNSDGLLPIIDDMLAMRQKACEEINAMYGLNISVEKDSSWEDREEMVNDPEEAETEETEEQPEAQPEEAEETEDAEDDADDNDADDSDEEKEGDKDD